MEDHIPRYAVFNAIGEKNFVLLINYAEHRDTMEWQYRHKDSQMTRKNYETFARMLAGELALAKRKGTLKLGVVDAQMRIENVIRATADIFAKDNERFDRERFYTACGMEV